MRFSEAATIIEACRAASRFVRIVPNFQGTNGIGKTVGIRAYAQGKDMGCIAKNLANDEPADLRGMPYADVAAARTRYLLPEDLPTADKTLIEILVEMARAADVSLMDVFGIKSAASFSGWVVLEGEKFLGVSDLSTQRRGAVKRAHAAVYKSLEKDGATGINQLRAYVALDQDANHDAFMAADMNLQRSYPEGVVHLDELNRALADTKQGSFSLLSEGRIGQYLLPSGWSVVVTENYEEGGEFDVSNFKDAAWSDRFVYLDWDMDAKAREDWSVWMTRKYGAFASAVIGTVNSDGKLFSVKNGQIPVAKPSPRSWEKVAALIAVRNQVAGFSDSIFNLLLIGLVGADAATIFHKEILPVTPQEILEDGVKAHKAVLATIASKRGSVIGLMAGVIGAARDTIGVNKKYQTHCLDFAEWITDSLTSNRDIVIAFLKSIMEASAREGDANGIFRTNMVGNEQVAKLVALGRKRLLSKERDKDFTDAILDREKLREAAAVLTGKRG